MKSVLLRISLRPDEGRISVATITKVAIDFTFIAGFFDSSQQDSCGMTGRISTSTDQHRIGGPRIGGPISTSSHYSLTFLVGGAWQ
jgi:hypothetical protein